MQLKNIVQVYFCFTCYSSVHYFPSLPPVPVVFCLAGTSTRALLSCYTTLVGLSLARCLADYCVVCLTRSTNPEVGVLLAVRLPFGGLPGSSLPFPRTRVTGLCPLLLLQFFIKKILHLCCIFVSLGID